MDTLFRAATLRSFAAGRPHTEAADILVSGRTIQDIAAAGSIPVRADTQVIDAAGHLVMPGLINGHFHSPVNHLKGSLDSLPLEIFMLYESPGLPGLMPSPRFAYIRTLLAAAEMLKSGVTSVQDDAFFVPFPTPDVIDAVCSAYADCGIRARVALDQSDLPEIGKLPFLAGLVPEGLRDKLAAPPEADAEALLAAYAHLISTWHGACEGRLLAAISCSAPQRVSDAYLGALDDLSKAHGLPFYVHILETRTQRVLGQQHGRSLVKNLAARGALTDRSNVIHAIWVDDDDLDIIAGAGATVAHNPISNLRLGSGVMPFRSLRDRGIPICLGTDEAIADDSVNMWGVAKMAGLIHNIADPDYERWPRAAEVLDCLIGGGAHAMRLNHRIGAIAPGMEADLIMLDLDTYPFTPLNDLDRQLVYCENGSSVRLTMVAGQVVVRDGVVKTVDERSLLREARALAAEQAGAAQTAEAAAPWLPHYREMYLRAAATDLGMMRAVPSADLRGPQKC
jgi:cytosine/adenosine deaminase-related metal-dependent hydrolase